MTKMILCVVSVLLISVPEGFLSNTSTDVPSITQSSTARSNTDTHTTTSTAVSSAIGSTTEPSTARSNTDTHTTTSTANGSAMRSTTEPSTARPTDDSSTSDTAGPEYTSGSQTTPLDFKRTTPQQTTQLNVTTRNQTTSHFTWQSQKSTVLKTPESTNETAFTIGQNSTTSSTALDNKGGHDVAGNPGLIAVLCIFFITVAVLLVIVIVKVVRSRRPQFERLDDVPMGKISEDAPFARYPPK